MPHTRNGQPRRRFPPEILTNVEICRLLDACSQRTPTSNLGEHAATLIRVETEIAGEVPSGVGVDQCTEHAAAAIDATLLAKRKFWFLCSEPHA